MRVNFLKDTPSSVEKVQFELFKRAGSTKQFERTLALSNWVLQMAKLAIHKRYPHLSQRDKNIFFIKTIYGSELAQKVRQYLERDSL